MKIHSMSRGLLPLGCLFLLAAAGRAELPEPARPPVLGLQAALHFGLENNPALAAQRKQRGIAAARVVIAGTYPFNPVLENRVQNASGPPSAGITNAVPGENLLLSEAEFRNHCRYRRQGAAAALNRAP